MMKRQTPDPANNTAIETFFAHLGLAVEVVDRCPDAACEQCSGALDEAA